MLIMKTVTDIIFGRLQDAYDDNPSSGGWSTSDGRIGLTQEETFKRLDRLDIAYIETYLRKKKIKKIKKK